jgi:uncharacterized protein (DUF2235 family)
MRRDYYPLSRTTGTMTPATDGADDTESSINGNHSIPQQNKILVLCFDGTTNAFDT